jgi:hypothetical protein
VKKALWKTKYPGKRITQLVDVDVSEISLVDKPANLKRFILFKALDGVPEESTPEQFAETCAQEWASLDAEQRAKITQEIEKMNALLDLYILQKHLDDLKKRDAFLWASVDSHPAQYNYDAETGTFEKREDFIAHPEADRPTHYFDFEAQKWLPKGNRK